MPVRLLSLAAKPLEGRQYWVNDDDLDYKRAGQTGWRKQNDEGYPGIHLIPWYRESLAVFFISVASTIF